jgi:hypothetical protein
VRVGHKVNLSIRHVNIMLPTHSGFKESWVRFADPSVKYTPPKVGPGKVAFGDFFTGSGF